MLNKNILTISQLNRNVRSLLESKFPMIWVEGEISNLAKPTSGHWYFSLKDDYAQVKCAMFRNRNSYLNFSPADGSHVIAKARVSLYEGRGDYQLIIEYLENAGEGELQKQFEELKIRLDREGLFSFHHKISPPDLPQQIGIITSSTGAAIRDVLKVLKRRFPAIPVMIYPTLVQGHSAAPEIVKMITKATHDNLCDVLIITRGGGSLEDLWAFNEEIVARAIYQCPIPIITGIGHEIDLTIADYVADLRAPTPSAAAEIATPDQNEWLTQLDQQAQRLIRLMKKYLQDYDTKINQLAKRHNQFEPGRQLLQKSQRIDELENRLYLLTQQKLEKLNAQITTKKSELLRYNPEIILANNNQCVNELNKRLELIIKQHLKNANNQFIKFAHALDTVSPLATLQRGYAIVRKNDNKTVVTNIKQVSPGEQVKTTIANGHLICKIMDILSNEK